MNARFHTPIKLENIEGLIHIKLVKLEKFSELPLLLFTFFVSRFSNGEKAWKTVKELAVLISIRGEQCESL